MLHLQQVWNEFGHAVRHSRVHEEEPLFAEWVSQMYAHTQAAAVRRMVDKDERSASFYDLLRRMAGNAQELEGAPEWWFGNRTIDPAEPRDDSDRLLELSARVRAYATKVVAHAAHRSADEMPTFDDLRDVIGEIERLLKKYILLLTGGNRAIGAPVPQTPWQRVFYEAWLPCPYGQESAD